MLRGFRSRRRHRLIITVHDINDGAANDPGLGFGMNVNRQREGLYVGIVLYELDVLDEE